MRGGLECRDAELRSTAPKGRDLPIEKSVNQHSVAGRCEAYAPAATCVSCPCDAVCADVFEGGASCCELGHVPYCVDATECP